MNVCFNVRPILLTGASLLALTSCTTNLGEVDPDDPGSIPGTPGGGNNRDGGNGGSGDDVGPGLVDNLQCDSYAWCTNLAPTNIQSPELPSTSGGTFREGLYRVEEGIAAALAFAFQNGRFTRIIASDFNLTGTYSVSGDVISFTNDGNCDENGLTEVNATFSSEYTFAVDGENLYLTTECSEYDDYCQPTWRLKMVSDLCASSASMGCPSGNCDCRVNVDQGFPSNSDGSSTCSL